MTGTRIVAAAACLAAVLAAGCSPAKSYDGATAAWEGALQSYLDDVINTAPPPDARAFLDVADDRWKALSDATDGLERFVGKDMTEADYAVLTEYVSAQRLQLSYARACLDEDGTAGEVFTACMQEVYSAGLGARVTAANDALARLVGGLTGPGLDP